LRDPDLRRNAPEGLAAVLLERLDDRPVDRVNASRPIDRTSASPVPVAAQCAAIRPRRLALRQWPTDLATSLSAPFDQVLDAYRAASSWAWQNWWKSGKPRERSSREAAGKEGAHGGTRGSPMLSPVLISRSWP